MGVVGVAWLVDAVSGAPSYTGRLNRQNTSAFLAGASTARPFGAVSGVRPGTSLTTVTATSTTWTAQTFGGVIDAEASALSGAYNFAFNLVTSGSVTASNATNPRIDTLAVRIDDPAEADGTSVPAVTLVYTTGTAAGTPVAPAAPARSFVVAQLAFPAGSGTTPTVTWVAPYAVAAGADRVAPTFAILDLVPGTYVGEKGRTPTITYRWSGSAWIAWESDYLTTTPVPVPGGGSFTATSLMTYKYTSGLIACTCTIAITNVGTASGGIVVALPVAATGSWVGAGRSEATGAMLQVRFDNVGGSIFTTTNGSPTAVGNLTVSGIYRPA